MRIYTKPLKILNLYAGIGGNRQKWHGDIEVTAVEYDEQIASVYQYFYPDDKVIVSDAHEYLLKHYKEFDFIWSSPPCQSHSLLNCSNFERFKSAGKLKYTDMSLYQEIIFLQTHCKCKWVVENVIPYYKPLIPPTTKLLKHLFWSNFNIPNCCNLKESRKHEDIKSGSTIYGVNLQKYKIGAIKKRQMLRNMVNPDIGLYVFERMLEKEIPMQNSLFDCA